MTRDENPSEESMRIAERLWTTQCDGENYPSIERIARALDERGRAGYEHAVRDSARVCGNCQKEILALLEPNGSTVEKIFRNSP